MSKEKYNLKKVTFNGKETWKLQCPVCGVWGYIDDDQKKGKISIMCECGGFHETIDFTNL